MISSDYPPLVLGDDAPPGDGCYPREWFDSMNNYGELLVALRDDQHVIEARLFPWASDRLRADLERYKASTEDPAKRLWVPDKCRMEHMGQSLMASVYPVLKNIELVVQKLHWEVTALRKEARRDSQDGAEQG